jgi:hypothetical protein
MASPVSGNPASAASSLAGDVPRWRNDLRALSFPLGIAAVVITFIDCLQKAPGAVYSSCGTCRGLSRGELASETAWVGVMCLAAWLMAWASGARLAVRVARSVGAACSGMWLAAWGFVWGWW